MVFLFLNVLFIVDFSKITFSDFEDESQIHFWRPHCGLISDDLLTDEVKELAMRLAQNHISDLINNFGKKLSRKFRLLSSRVLNAYYKEINSVIKMLVEYIESIYNELPNLIEDMDKVTGNYRREIFLLEIHPKKKLTPYTKT